METEVQISKDPPQDKEQPNSLLDDLLQDDFGKRQMPVRSIKPPRERQSVILEEYRLSQEYIISIHERIWQIGAILIAASLGAFAIVASQSSIAISTLVASVMAGIVSTLVLVIWFFIRERFTFLMEVSFYRMREIEGELELWRNRYIDFLDNPRHYRTTPFTGVEKQRLELLKVAFKNRNNKIRTRTMEILLLLIVALTWLFWIIYQIAVLLGYLPKL